MADRRASTMMIFPRFDTRAFLEGQRLAPDAAKVAKAAKLGESADQFSNFSRFSRQSPSFGLERRTRAPGGVSEPGAAGGPSRGQGFDWRAFFEERFAVV